MSLSFVSSLYTGANQSGNAILAGVSVTTRYNEITSEFMQNQGIYKALTSTRVHDSNLAAGSLILFKPFFDTLPSSDYDGQFVQITNAKGADDDFDVDNLDSLGFNNKATSALVVARDRNTEFALSFRSMFLDEWKNTIDDELGDDAERIGDPTLTWTMFPKGVSHLNSTRRYLYVSQKLNIIIGGWPDYEARIRYHIRLFLNNNGNVRASVPRWSYWIEGGIKSDGIAEQLEPKVINGMNVLSTQLNSLLAGFDSFVWSDLFFLPGNQADSAANAVTGIVGGTTYDDVTIVLQI